MLMLQLLLFLSYLGKTDRAIYIYFQSGGERFTSSSSVFIVNFEQLHPYWNDNDYKYNNDNSHDEDVDRTDLTVNQNIV